MKHDQLPDGVNKTCYSTGYKSEKKYQSEKERKQQELIGKSKSKLMSQGRG